MEKEHSRLGEKIKGMLHLLDGPKAAADEKSEEAQGPDTAPKPVEQPPEVETDRIALSEGALLEVWRHWKQEEAPPVLSLAEEGVDLPLDKQARLRERVRLSLFLARDAKDRLSALREAEEENARLPPSCQVYLSENRMVAWVFLFPPSDAAEELPIELIGKAMQENGITTGVDSTAVTRLFQEKPYFKLIPIAFGTPMVPGEDGKIVERYPRELPLEIKVDENGVADYRAINYVQIVNKGDVICDIIPPREGTPGICVDGSVVEPKKARMEKIPSGRNTVLSEDGLHLLAAQNGHLQYINREFHVRQVLEVKGDVDYSTGNVDFNGDVHISGDVRDNFSVRATGTITIDGLVEAATIEAGGDLLIGSGVLGNYKATLKSWGCVRVKYLENCVVYANKSVYADCIMASQVFSDDTIQVTSGRGTVIGGTLTAAYTVKARLIGSQAGRKTVVRLGELPFAEAAASSNQAELDQLREEMHHLDTEMKDLVERHGMSGGAELSKAQIRKSVLALREMRLLKNKEKLNPVAPELSRCRLEASVMYPITQVFIGIACLNVEGIRNHCKLKYDDQLGEIQMI